PERHPVNAQDLGRIMCLPSTDPGFGKLGGLTIGQIHEQNPLPLFSELDEGAAHLRLSIVGMRGNDQVVVAHGALLAFRQPFITTAHQWETAPSGVFSPRRAMTRCSRSLASCATVVTCTLPTMPSMASGSTASMRHPSVVSRITTLQGSRSPI